MQDLLGGQIDSVFDPVTTNVNQLQAGSLRALAISTPNRLPALANIPTPNGAIRLASPLTITEFCHVLYETLRCADQMGINVISVLPPKAGGLGDAINDRLNRAKSKF